MLDRRGGIEEGGAEGGLVEGVQRGGAVAGEIGEEEADVDFVGVAVGEAAVEREARGVALVAEELGHLLIEAGAGAEVIRAFVADDLGDEDVDGAP